MLPLALALAIACPQGPTSQPGVPARPTPLALGPPNPANPVDFVGAQRGHIQAVATVVTLEPPLVRVAIEVELRNRSGKDDAFELLLPLGGDTAVSGLSAGIDGEKVAGELLRSEAARALIAELARERRDPALLAHYGQAVFRQTVALPAGAQRRVTVEYARAVEREGDLWRVHVPLGALKTAGPVSLEVRGEVRTAQPLSTLYSPTHELRETQRFVTWAGSTQRTHTAFEYVAAETTPSDLVFFAKAATHEELLDVAVLSERPDADEPGVFLAVIGGMADAVLEPEPKNVVFVLDRSGSMQGEKIEQAKAALLYLARQLRAEDRFNLVSYSNDALSFTQDLTTADGRTLSDLEGHVTELKAEGGTNIEAALTSALGMFASRSDALNQVVFLTDGLPTQGEANEAALTRIVREANTEAARLVVFGVGFDVNGALLDRLAAENRGAAEYVLPDQDVAERVAGFYERVRSPLVLDAQVVFEGGDVQDVHPRLVGDVYAGHRLVLAGRYEKGGAARLLVRGRRGRTPLELAFPIELARETEPEETSGLLGRIWAAKQIGTLVDELRLATGEPDAAAVRSIVDLGTRFGVLTEYTAFLAEPETNLAARSDNWSRCTEELRARTEVVSGSHGVAQACNTKNLQRCDQVQGNTWVGADGRNVTVGGVRCVAGRTFFQRGARWVDSAGDTSDARKVELYSDEFYDYLDRYRWLGACVARTGDVTLDVAGQRVRFAE